MGIVVANEPENIHWFMTEAWKLNREAKLHGLEETEDRDPPPDRFHQGCFESSSLDDRCQVGEASGKCRKCGERIAPSDLRHEVSHVWLISPLLKGEGLASEMTKDSDGLDH